MTIDKDPLRPSQSRSEAFSPQRSEIDRIVIDGLARAISEAHIEKEFGEGLIRAYLAGRNEKSPQE